MTIAEVLFILLGIALGVWPLGGNDSSGQTVAAAFLGVGSCLWDCGVCVRTGARALSSAGYWRFPAASIPPGLFFLGWMAEALEVYVIIYYLGGPAMALSAISIGALSVFIKGGTFFIPGSLGAQDGGNMLLLRAFGYSDVTGITFALLRRFRELVWIGLGLFCLTLVGGRSVIIQAGRTLDSGNGS